MDIATKQKQLEDKVKEAADKLKAQKEALKQFFKSSEVMKAENTKKNWYGIACISCMEVIKNNPDVAKAINDFLEKNVKKNSERKLLGLPKLEKKASSAQARASATPPMATAASVPAPQSSAKRTDLNVPFGEKEAAKAAGAKWDREKGLWYFIGDDLTPVKRWLSAV